MDEFTKSQIERMSAQILVLEQILKASGGITTDTLKHASDYFTNITHGTVEFSVSSRRIQTEAKAYISHLSEQ